MSELRKVAITNNTRGVFYYAIANRHVKREIAAGGVLRVPFEELQEALYERGIMQAFKEGKLKVADEQDAIDLELKAYAPKLAIGEKEILEILTNGSDEEKFAMIRDANPVMKDLIISLAIENKISSQEVVKPIKQFFNYDILAAIVKTQ